MRKLYAVLRFATELKEFGELYTYKVPCIDAQREEMRWATDALRKLADDITGLADRADEEGYRIALRGWGRRKLG